MKSAWATDRAGRIHVGNLGDRLPRYSSGHERTITCGEGDDLGRLRWSCLGIGGAGCGDRRWLRLGCELCCGGVAPVLFHADAGCRLLLEGQSCNVNSVPGGEETGSKAAVRGRCVPELQRASCAGSLLGSQSDSLWRVPGATQHQRLFLYLPQCIHPTAVTGQQPWPSRADLCNQLRSVMGTGFYNGEGGCVETGASCRSREQAGETSLATKNVESTTCGSRLDRNAPW